VTDLVQSSGVESADDWAYEVEGAESSAVYIEGQELEMDNERPSAKALIVLIAFFLLPKGLVASSWISNYVPLPFGLYASWADLWSIVFAFTVVLARVLGMFSNGILRSTRRWYLMPILLFGILQTVSLSWNGRPPLERGYSFVQTVLMCAPVLTAVLLVSGLSYANRMKVVCGLILILTFLVLVYLGLSFVFPGLRPSSAWKYRIMPGLGFIRVFGPLAPSTSLNFVLFPALGFTMGMLFVPGRSKVFWGLITFVFFVTIIGTGSRGAVLCMAAFGILILVTLSITKALKVIVPVALIFGAVIFFTGIPERYFTMEDTYRTDTYKTGFRAFSFRPRNVIVGVGHGGLYSLLHDNTLRRLHGKTTWYLKTKDTEFGFTLTNSHSTILQSLIETGIVGFVLLMTALLWVLRRFLGRRYRRCRDPWTMQARLTLAGCAASMVLMITSVFFYHVCWLVFIWSILAVTAAETTAESSWYSATHQLYAADESLHYSDE
jgi:O-antigen ligase